ncbi:uncharacterized protein TNCV_3697661 [Trichonephila clavipes]|uniref:Uncharacterized protein n=1 Tax=Trichonephila clavipes TaxID=2585209 RepID=A0A8X6VJR5_TRICX|nr:uncharacterized protein TNCV_3697661 [Trichonephila clavipes]
MLHISRPASTMDQIDAFPEHISTTVMPMTLPEKPDALEYAAWQGQVRVCIIYQKSNTKRVFILFCKDNWYQTKTLGNNFKRQEDDALSSNGVGTPHGIPDSGCNPLHLVEDTKDCGLDIIPETILTQLIENGINLGDFRKKMKRYYQKAYKLPPPTPAHVPAETNKRPLEEQPGPLSKRFPNRVFITPIIRPSVAPVLIARPSQLPWPPLNP